MIGIISDTHDNMDAIRKAVEFFNSEDVDLVLHAGDMISPFTVEEFKKLDAPMYAVFGNNDGEREGLNKKFSEMGTKLDDLVNLEYQGKQICIYHGTNDSIVNALLKSRHYDLVVKGHAHEVEVDKYEDTILINPGEACGYLTGRRTIGILDIDKMEFDVKEI